MRPLTLRALAVQPDLGVHREREVERRRALRQLDDVARRREDEDLVLVQVELEELEELVGRLARPAAARAPAGTTAGADRARRLFASSL